jgi:hypothetical protein
LRSALDAWTDTGSAPTQARRPDPAPGGASLLDSFNPPDKGGVKITFLDEDKEER